MTKIHRKLCLALTVMVISLGNEGCTKGLRVNRHLSRGDRAFKEQKYDEAELEYLKVLQASPVQPDAIRQLGIIYQEEGKLVHARRFLTKAVELDPGNAQVRLKLALNELNLGESAKAVQDARLVLAKMPGQPEALELIAGASESTNNFVSVQQEIEAFRRADQDRGSYHVAFGTVALRRQDLTNAETEFKKALELDPKSNAALLGLANIYWGRKDLAGAEQAFKAAAESSPLRSGVRLKYAQFECVTGKIEQAKTQIEQLTSSAPDYLPAWNLLAQIAYGENKYGDCNSLLQRVLARDSFNLDALILDATLKLAQHEPAKAIAVLTQATSFYKGMPQLQLLLARGHLMNQDISKATVCLNEAVRLNPNFAEAVLLLANVNLQKHDPAPAIASLNQLLKRQPHLAQAYVILAEAYSAQKDSAQALEVGRRMVEAFPKSADAQLVLGTLLVRSGQKAEARKAFETAQSLSSADYMPAMEKLVELDLSEKQFDAAKQRIQARIDAKPQAADAWLLMARVHLAQAEEMVAAENRKTPGEQKLKLANVSAAQPEASQAESALLKAIELSPGLRSAYFILAQLYIANGKQKEALDRLNGLLSRTNDVVALMQVGMIYNSISNYPAAKDAYEKVIAAEPNFTLALNNLAYLYSESPDTLDKAYTLATKARQVSPNDASTADTLSWILYKKEDYARALALAQESAAKLGDQPEIQYHLGMAEYMSGDEDAARTALQEAVSKGKDFPGKDEASRCLTILNFDSKTADASVEAIIQKQLQASPRDWVALERLGAIQQRNGQLDKAVETYQNALKINAKDSSLNLKIAQLYASPGLNDPQKALAFAKTAHDKSPDDPRISELLGSLVWRSGDYKWATSLLEDSARKLPDDPQISFDLAWAYYSVGRVSDAKDLMQNLLNKSASFVKADEAKRFLQMVNASTNVTQANAALADAQKLLTSDALYVPALMVSAVAQEGQGKFEPASATYRQILSQYPQFTPATRNLGLLYFAHLGDDQKAYDLVTKARESYPRDPEVAKALGVLTYRKGNYSRAAQLLTESGQARKGDAELLYYLGMAQYKLKARPESKAALEQALSFDLPSALATDAKRVLAELK